MRDEMWKRKKKKNRKGKWKKGEKKENSERRNKSSEDLKLNRSPSVAWWLSRGSLTRDMAAAWSDILVLDLTSTRFSVVQLPHGVTHDERRARLSSVYDAAAIYILYMSNNCSFTSGSTREMTGHWWTPLICVRCWPVCAC